MEKVSKFGKYKNLVGIYSPPVEKGSLSGDTAIMILNSGLVHRAGPFRENAELAQFLSRAGISVFRFDLSGIGDSEISRNDKRPYRERFSDDIGEAIDFLHTRYKIDKIIVFGLCTGAELAHYAAVRYSQIIGSILIDGYGYPTRTFLVKRYGPVLVDSRRLVKATGKLAGKFLSSNQPKNDSEHLEGYLWELPDKNDYISQMQLIHEKGVKQFFVFTGGVKSYYNYQNQFHDGFGSYPFANDVTVEFFEDSDHTFILLEQRRQLFDTILSWLHLTFAVDAVNQDDKATRA